MKKTMLVDGDILAYRAAASAEERFNFGDGVTVSLKEDFDHVIEHMEKRLANASKFGKPVICLSDDNSNWRKEILPSYKENRKDNIKPQFLGHAKDWLRENYTVYERPNLEADDVMGILSTHPTIIKGAKCILSQDKDMASVPGWLFNPDKHEKPIKISQELADQNHLIQTLTGDTTDNYKGCPGIGPVKAAKALVGVPPQDMWSVVVTLFETAGLTEEDALVQARVARICRHEDYDYKTKKVKPWTPNE